MDIIYMLGDKSTSRRECTQHAIADRLDGVIVINYRGQVIPNVTRSYLQRTIQVAMMPKCVHRAFIRLAVRGPKATPFRISYVAELYAAFVADGKREGKQFRDAWKRMVADPYVTIRLRESNMAYLADTLTDRQWERVFGRAA